MHKAETGVKPPLRDERVTATAGQPFRLPPIHWPFRMVVLSPFRQEVA